MTKLKNLKSSQLKRAPRYIVYGQEGTGKTTLCSGAHDSIYIDIEGGAGDLLLTRIPFPEGHATTYTQVLDALDAILTQEHDFKSVIIDTIDRLESLIWEHVCSKANNNIKNIEDFGYGKGYVVALTAWRQLACKLDLIRERRGMTVVLIGHSIIKTFKNPEGDDYDRYSLRLNEKAGGFLKEWADVVAFMRFDEGSSKLKGDIRAKGFSTGKRYIYTKRTAAYDAKTRIKISDEIESKGPQSWECLVPSDKPVQLVDSKNPF